MLFVASSTTRSLWGPSIELFFFRSWFMSPPLSGSKAKYPNIIFSIRHLLYLFIILIPYFLPSKIIIILFSFYFLPGIFRMIDIIIFQLIQISISLTILLFLLLSDYFRILLVIIEYLFFLINFYHSIFGFILWSTILLDSYFIFPFLVEYFLFIVHSFKLSYHYLII